MGPIPRCPARTDRSSRGASPHALSSCHLRSGVNGAETRRPHDPHRAQRPLRARSTKAGAETPATLLIGVERLHGRNSVPDLGTTDCDVDHLFGPYLAVDVVMDPQMPRNLRQVTPWSHAALESPRVRKFPVQSTQGSPSS